MFGAKATRFQKKLQDAKQAALVEICRQTNDLDGNAIIGLDFDFMTMSRNILMVSANGTAVEIETD